MENYRGYNGFRLNSTLYGAHPEENELLLPDGVQVQVMGIEEIVI